MALTQPQADVIGTVASLLPSSQSTSASASGTTTTQLKLDSAGYNKIIQDILSADGGLASLATGENLSGGYGSSVKAQLAQDMVLNIAGEMAKLTAPTVQTTEQQSKSKTKKRMSVICTELERQGLLDTQLYEAGHAHFLTLPAQTVAGYRIWANKVVPVLRDNPKLAKFLAPAVNARYQYIVNKKFSVIGAATVYIGQPVCYLIGTVVLAIYGDKNGNLSATA